MKILFTLVFSFSGLCSVLFAQVAPIVHGHAHNDYVHHRPLFQALENGFTSIEMDVFLHRNELVVSHIAVGLNHKKTIQQLYLDPIAKIIRANGGWVYKGYSQPVIFMVEFKSDAEASYQKLKEVLSAYPDIFTVYRGDSVIQQKAINILITGHSAVGPLSKENTAMATNDASIGAIGDAATRNVSTRFSSAWGSYFRWRGFGKMPKKQKLILQDLVKKVHAYHKQIRFWAIPDRPKVWRQLLDAGVDWVNTNRLDAYHQFIVSRYKP